ncbi:MAG: hypothetical protein R2882_14010 [Gemmatimonadales bacterium]
MDAAEPALDFGAALARTVARAESYGLAVEVVDVTDPNTGDLDGRTILLDHLLTEEEKLFLLLHLFGHCVQWNTSPEARSVGQAEFQPVTEEEYRAVFEYEKEASRFGLQLLLEAGVAGAERWLTDLWYADWLYLQHFYRTGERRDPGEFHRAGAHPLLDPREIPPFTPAVWPRRFAI